MFSFAWFFLACTLPEKVVNISVGDAGDDETTSVVSDSAENLVDNCDNTDFPDEVEVDLHCETPLSVGPISVSTLWSRSTFQQFQNETNEEKIVLTK